MTAKIAAMYLHVLSICTDIRSCYATANVAAMYQPLLLLCTDICSCYVPESVACYVTATIAAMQQYLLLLCNKVGWTSATDLGTGIFDFSLMIPVGAMSLWAPL